MESSRSPTLSTHFIPFELLSAPTRRRVRRGVGVPRTQDIFRLDKSSVGRRFLAPIRRPRHPRRHVFAPAISVSLRRRRWPKG